MSPISELGIGNRDNNTYCALASCIATLCQSPEVRIQSAPMEEKIMTHLRMKKKISLSALKPSTADCLLWVSQMAIQDFLRQSQRPTAQELADQCELFLKGMVGWSDRSTIFLP